MWEVLLPLISFWMSFRVTPKKIDALLSEKKRRRPKQRGICRAGGGARRVRPIDGARI